jgi:hypothetical protein
MNLQKLFSAALVFFLVNYVSAQQKVTPPPTKITLPSDTTTVKKRVGVKDSQLELPDVLILGKDLATRVVGNKKQITADSPTIIRPGSSYEPLSTWFTGEAFKPRLETESWVNDRMSWVSLQGGGYSTINADAGHWQKIGLGGYRINGWFERSSGQFPNSQYSQGGLMGKINYALAPQVTGMTNVHYSLYKRGLHGAALRDMVRSGSIGGFGADLQYDINRLSDGNVGFEISNASMKSDTSSLRYDASDDFWYRLNGDYTISLSAVQFTLAGRYLRDAFKLRDDSTTTKSALGDIVLETHAQFSHKLSAVLGLMYQFADSDSLSQENRFSPFGRFNYMPSDRFGITLSATTGYQLKTFSQWWQNNPYLAHRVPQHISETRVGVSADCDYEILENFKVQVGLSRYWMNNMFYWQMNPHTQLVDLLSLEKPELTEIRIGMIAEVNDYTRLQVYFISYSDKLDDEDIQSTGYGIPYRPEYRIPIRAAIRLLTDMHLVLAADIIGKRRIRIDEKKTLDPYGLMQITLAKNFGRNYSALVTVRNLLDSEYERWEHYPETGVHVLLGVRAKI